MGVGGEHIHVEALKAETMLSFTPFVADKNLLLVVVEAPPISIMHSFISARLICTCDLLEGIATHFTMRNVSSVAVISLIL